MTTGNLFSEQESCVDLTQEFKWHAYVSSALTLSDAATRDRVKGLNRLIKENVEKRLNTFTYLPQEYSDPSRGDKMKPEEIYILDRWRIAESDFIIMNLDTPSFGVGQEAEIACSMGIPIIAFHYEGNVVSRIIRGMPGLYSGEESNIPSEGLISYKDQQTYRDLIGDLIAKIGKVQKHLESISNKPYITLPFSDRLKRAIEKSGKTEAEIAKNTGFTEAFIHSLLNNYKSVENVLESYGLIKLCKMRQIPHDRYLNPGLWVLRKLSEALDIRLSALIGEDELDRIWHEPLVKLSRKGVSLEDFIDVSDKAGYLIIHQKAARVADRNNSSEQVAEQLYELVQDMKNEKPK
jgi:transcriptional regulator with XRE-family HTH domain